MSGSSFLTMLGYYCKCCKSLLLKSLYSLYVHERASDDRKGIIGINRFALMLLICVCLPCTCGMSAMWSDAMMANPKFVYPKRPGAGGQREQGSETRARGQVGGSEPDRAV
jgi:hypothetical protein